MQLLPRAQDQSGGAGLAELDGMCQNLKEQEKDAEERTFICAGNLASCWSPHDKGETMFNQEIKKISERDVRETMVVRAESTREMGHTFEAPRHVTRWRPSLELLSPNFKS